MCVLRPKRPMDVNMRFDFSNYWYGNEVNKFFFCTFLFVCTYLLYATPNAHVFFLPLFAFFFYAQRSMRIIICVLHLVFVHLNPFNGRTFHVKKCKLTWIKGWLLYMMLNSFLKIHKKFSFILKPANLCEMCQFVVLSLKIEMKFRSRLPLSHVISFCLL